jgi:hypothetical protein
LSKQGAAFEKADYDGDGKVTVKDAVNIFVEHYNLYHEEKPRGDAHEVIDPTSTPLSLSFYLYLYLPISRSKSKCVVMHLFASLPYACGKLVYAYGSCLTQTFSSRER